MQLGTALLVDPVRSAHDFICRGVVEQPQGVLKDGCALKNGLKCWLRSVTTTVPGPGRQLMKLKADWRVSMQALLRRAKTLVVMSPTLFTNAMKLFSARGWRTEEPGDDLLGPLEAARLLELALDRLDADGLTLEDLCLERALPVAEIKELLADTADERPRIEL